MKPYLSQQINSKAFIVTLLLILIITFISFSSSLNNGFVNYWDDNLHLLENLSIRSLNQTNLKNIFTSTVCRTYIPLTIISFAIEHHFFDFNPFGYHLNNILLHLIVVALVFIFCLRIGLSIRQAGIASLLFGIHPMHVESVAWVTERKDVLYGVFYMLALNYYWVYINKGKRIHYFCTIVFGILSMLSKAMALSLPLVFFILDWFAQRKFTAKTIIEKIPYFLYIIPIAWITFSINFDEYSVNPDIFKAVIIFIWSLVFYLQKFFFPVNVGPIYDLPIPISFFNVEYILSIVTLLVIVVIVISFRKNKLLLFALSFYLASIFFLLRYDFVHNTNMVADRWMYLPSLGFCMLIGVIFDKIYDKIKKKIRWSKEIYLIVVILLFGFLGLKSYVLCSIWKNSETLLNFIIYNSDPKDVVFNNRGVVYQELGKYDLAISDYSMAIELDPQYDEAYNNRGLVYYSKGQSDKALDDLNKALYINPESSEALNSRGIIYRGKGQFDLAIKDFNKSMAINPNNPNVYNNRGNAFLDMGKYDLAVKDFTKAIELKQNFIEPYGSRAMAYQRIGNYDLALNDYSNAIDFNPDFVEAYSNRGIIYQIKGLYDLAIDDYNNALKIKPNYEIGLINRAVVYQTIGSFDLAIEDYNKVISLNPDNSEAYRNRGTAYFQTGNYDLARDDFNRAIKIDPDDPISYYNLSVLNKEKGDYENALKNLQKAKSLGHRVDEKEINKLRSLKNK